MRSTVPTGDTAALAALVSAEDAAVFGVSGLGGRLANLAPGTDGALRLRGLYDVHRARRDRWALLLRARQGQVPEAAAAYALPTAATAAQALQGAADVEARCAQAYGAALEQLTDPALRSEVLPCLVDASRQAYALGTQGGRSPATASSALPGTAG